MSFKRKMVKANEEEVLFQCLCCHQTNFRGKRNKLTKELKASSLLKHMKQKKSRSGEYECLRWYDEIKIGSGLQDYDFSSSLMQEYQDQTSTNVAQQGPTPQEKPPTSSCKRSYEDPSAGSFAGDDDASSLSDTENLGEFKEVVLPKSNSLTGRACFSNNFPSSLKVHREVNNSKFDSYTYPSKKLLPPISYQTILDYAKSQGLVPKIEAKANEYLMQQQNHSLIIMDEEQSATSGGLPSDYDTQEGSSEDELSIGLENQNATHHEVAPPPMDQDFSPYLLSRLEMETRNRRDRADELPPYLKVHLQLLQLQEKHKMSFAAMEDVLQWARMATSLQEDIFVERFPPRQTMVEQYRVLLGLDPEAYKFKETVVKWLPDNKPVIIQRRPFLDCVYELLTKECLLGENSCNISLPHPTDPYACEPQVESPTISEVHQGTWWRKTMKQCCKGPRDILCPLVFEVDETYLDTHGRLTVTPFNIRLLLFNVATNKSEEASTTWFFLPNDEAEAAHHERKTLAIHKIQNLHTALRECFKDLKTIMDQNIGIPWKLTYGGKEHKVNLKFALAFIVSDTQMHDKLCCHYAVRNHKIKAICRHCDCATKHLSSWKHFRQYSNWTVQELDPTQQMDKDQDYWKSISHYPVKNAVDELYHGTNKAKTHLNTCGEVLHMHQKGAMERVIESFVFVWTKGKGIEIDDVKMSKKQVKIKESLDNLNYLGHQYGALLNRQSDRDKSRTKFKNSLFVTTKKCAHEHQGVLLCVLLSLLSDRGRQICLEERTMTEEWLENQVYILELILMVEVWMKKREFPREHLRCPEALGKAIGSYMDLLTVICPREGMGNLLVKFHLMFHVPEYVMRWGPPTVFDSSILERSHKTQAKGPARLTQQRPETFMTQLPSRYTDRRIVKRFRDFFRLDRMFDRFLLSDNQTDAPIQEEEPIGTATTGKPMSTGSSFTLGIDRHGKAGVRWSKRAGRQTHPQEVQDFVAKILLPNLTPAANSVVEGFTEYKVSLDDKPQIFRAHPSYRSTSRQQRDVWYDWAKFDLAQHNLGPTPLPGQILMFVHVPHLKDEVKHRGVRLLPNHPHAVVRLFKGRPRDNYRPGQRSRGVIVPYSSLVKFGTLRDHLMIVPCKYIVAPAIVVPNVAMRKHRPWVPSGKKKKRKQEEDLARPLGSGYFVVDTRIEWGECFGRLIETFLPS